MENVDIIDPVTDSRWDKFVENHPFGWIVHTSGWKRVLERNFPHMKGHYLVLQDSSTNEIQAGLPLFEVRSWLTGNRLISIPFATISDPLVSTGEQADSLLKAALNLSHKVGVDNIQIRTLNAHNILKNDEYVCDRHFVHHYLPLNGSIERIKKTFHYKAVQYEINKAIKSNMTFKIAEEESDLVCFYELYMKTRKKLGLPPQPYLLFKSLWDIFSPTKNVMVLLAISNKKVASAHFMFLFNERVSVEAVGWDVENKDSPNHFLFWEGIKMSYGMGYRIYDFGRTARDNHNLINFKNRWGTTVVDLPFYFSPKSHHEKTVELGNSAGYKLIQMLCKNSPDLFYPFIGRFCYRHLG
jgi:hypothetical protein